MGRKPEGKAEKMFKDLGKKIDKLIEELKVAKAQAGDEIDDRVEELKRNRDTLKDRFKDFREDDRWSEVEKNLENAGKELKKAFKTTFAKKDKE